MRRLNCTTRGTQLKFIRSTAHYTAWCNSLTRAQLRLQQYREVTVIHPTWFLSRAAFDAVGGYQVQPGRGTAKPIPSDLIFFHAHLDAGGVVDRVEAPLVTYRRQRVLEI